MKSVIGVERAEFLARGAGGNSMGKWLEKRDNKLFEFLLVKGNLMERVCAVHTLT